MRRDAQVRARVAALTAADRVVICTITRGEILYGLARLPEGKRRSALEAEAMSLFGQLVCLAVPEAAADQYASIKWEAHIPLNYVVTPRCSHSGLDLSIRYPHDVSSAPMAISTEGETWDKLPKRHEETAPSPSISKMNPPTFG